MVSHTFQNFNFAHEFHPFLHLEKKPHHQTKSSFRDLEWFYSKAPLILKQYHLSTFLFPAGRH